MNVFLVTTGEYSAYGVRAIFSTRELAEAHIEKMSRLTGYDSPGIEEWPVDSECEAEIRTVYTAVLNLSDGSLLGRDETKKELIAPGAGNSTEVYPARVGFNAKGTAVGRSVKSAEHAFKLAAEARQAFLREQAEVKP